MFFEKQKETEPSRDICLLQQSRNRRDEADLHQRHVSVNRMAALWSSGPSPTTIRQHVCVYASPCAPRCIFFPRSTSYKTKEFLCPEQKHEGNSDQRTTYEVRLHTRSCCSFHISIAIHHSVQLVCSRQRELTVT